MALKRKYTVMWIVWILAFLGLEFAAIRNRAPGDTLSEHVWDWIGTGTPRRTAGMWIARGLLGGLLVWLVPHFFTRGL